MAASVWLTISVSFSSPVKASPILPPVDVIIDAGHGGVDSGAFYDTLYEKDINLQVAKRLYDELAGRGLNVILNRIGDYALSDENQWLQIRSRHRKDLAQRAQLAQQMSPRLMISLHVNWARHSAARGPLVIYPDNQQAQILARLLQHQLNELYKTHRQPVHADTYYLLKHSGCPVVIVEMGYITNRQDRKLMTRPAHQTRIGREIAAAVEEYLLVFGFLQMKGTADSSY
ncbi:MAG: N-acetylmuramoyl-L-alanine amidase [Brevibacillus sp.]|nr:N-acetylmuramoyl-L-alanine amidase [Brevibacillus sp.]